MKISTSSKVHVFKFLCFLFRDSHFRVLVLGRENLENLDLTKISCYTVPQQEKQSFTYLEALIDSRTLKKSCALVAPTEIQQTQEL